MVWGCAPDLHLFLTRLSDCTKKSLMEQFFIEDSECVPQLSRLHQASEMSRHPNRHDCDCCYYCSTVCVWLTPPPE